MKGADTLMDALMDGPATQADIAAATGMSIPSVSLLLTALIKKRLVILAGTKLKTAPARGAAPKLYAMARTKAAT